MKRSSLHHFCLNGFTDFISGLLAPPLLLQNWVYELVKTWHGPQTWVRVRTEVLPRAAATQQGLFIPLPLPQQPWRLESRVDRAAWLAGNAPWTAQHSDTEVWDGRRGWCILSITYSLSRLMEWLSKVKENTGKCFPGNSSSCPTQEAVLYSTGNQMYYAQLGREG